MYQGASTRRGLFVARVLSGLQMNLKTSTHRIIQDLKRVIICWDDIHDD